MNGLLELPSSACDAYELLSVPVWIFSVETLEIIASNSAARDWLGHSADAFHSMAIDEICPLQDRAQIRDRIRDFQHLAGEGGLWTVVSRTGDRYTVRSDWRRLRVGGQDAILASIHDITPTGTADSSKPATTQAAPQRLYATLPGRHLAEVIAALPGMTAVLSLPGYRIVAVTDDYARTMLRQRDDLIGLPLFDLLTEDPAHPELRNLSSLRASLQRVRDLNVPDVLNIPDFPLPLPDGSLNGRSCLIVNKPVFDAEGQLGFILHRVEDVTELPDWPENAVPMENTLPLMRVRTALLALQERDKRLKAAERLLDVGSWEMDLHKRTVRWSARVFDLTGIPVEMGESDLEQYMEIVHPNDRKATAAAFEAFIEGDAPEVEFLHRLIRPDGESVHIRAVGARHRIGGHDMLVGFVQDISGYRQAEEHLRQVLRIQKVAGYIAKVGGWRVDLLRQSLSWSAETAKIFELPENPPPRFEELVRHCITADRERFGIAFEGCVRTGQPFDETLQIITGRGRSVWIRAIGAPVYDLDDQVIAIEGAFQDITDMVEARVAADEIARRLRATLENISDAFLLLDTDWRCTFLNSQGEFLLRRRREDLIGRNVWDEFPDAVGSRFQTEYQRAVATNEAVRFQEFFAPLDCWFEVSAYPTPEGVAIYFRDVTRQRQRDDHLRFLEAAVERQNDMVVITEAEDVLGPDGPRIVYVNEAFTRHMGYARHEVIGKTPRILQGSKTQRHELDRIAVAMRKWRSVRAELINYTRSGKEVWVELDIAPVADKTGRYTHWIAVERNITERKLAEQAMKTTDERFRLIATATGTAIWDWDVPQNRLWWSDGMTRIFGHDTDPAATIPTIWKANVHPDDMERVDRALADLLSGAVSSLREQYGFRRADGIWTVVEDRAFAIRDDEDRVVRVIGSLTDISDRLHLEERLRQAQKMEAVGQLTGGVAHDFNNLLTVILGSAEIIAERLDGLPELRKLAVMTMEAAEKGAELTSRLLAFSRKQPLEPKVVDIGHVVERLEDLLARTLPESIDLEIVCAEDIHTVEIDPGQFESALLNLVINARDAMADGGNLTIEVINATLDEGYTAAEPELVAGDYVLVAVTDTGQGIPAELLDRVYEPFFTTKEVGKGSGLGLSMVFGFVKQSNGHIRIYSEQGDGTTVKLYFPHLATFAKESVAIPPSPKFIGGTETILVVEDDDLVCDHVMGLLKSLGYAAIKASNGHEALQVLAKTASIDLLFTDVVMPGGMGGRELSEAARKMRPGLRVLFTSGYTENSIVHNGRLDAGVELISKPYGREQLAMKLRKVFATPPENL